MDKLTKDYSCIGHYRYGFFRSFTVYYSPMRFHSWAIDTGKEVKYFDSPKGCLDYAVSRKWIKADDVPRLLVRFAEKENSLDDVYFHSLRQETPEISMKPFMEKR